jgi:hypothetical protein
MTKLSEADEEPKRRRPRGRPRLSSKWAPDSDKWSDMEWIDRRAEELDGPKQNRKQRATSELFMRRVSKREQTDDNFRRFEKYIKNARDEWRRIDRAMKVADEKRLKIRRAKGIFKAR